MNTSDMEKAFLENASDSYAVYQLKMSPHTHDLLFESFDNLMAHQLAVDRMNYELVYTGTLDDRTPNDTSALLEDLFYRFNMEIPSDYHGHSMSVSDVVALKINGNVQCFYTDSMDFQFLPDFLHKAAMRNAELATEDDGDMLDGIINNGKKPELEQKQPSLHDLLQQSAHDGKQKPPSGKHAEMER